MNHVKMFLAAALVLVGAQSVASVANASDACTNVKFKFINHHSDHGRASAIKVNKVEYYNSDSGKWRTEDVVNVECAVNATCTTKGDNLTDAEARNITKVKFHYFYKETDGQWSKEFTGGEKSIASGDQRCAAGKTYGTFEIVGTP